MLEPCGSMARSGKITRMELELTRKFQKQARQVPGVRYVQGNWKRNIGTVRAGLVPSLNSCSDGAKDYSQVDGKRLPPPCRISFLRVSRLESSRSSISSKVGGFWVIRAPRRRSGSMCPRPWASANSSTSRRRVVRGMFASGFLTLHTSS